MKSFQSFAFRSLAAAQFGAMMLASAVYAQDHGHAPDAAHAADSHAAAAGHGGEAGVLPTMAQGIVPAIVSLLVFGAVFTILAAFVWPKISKGLDDRATKIREEIAAAEAARKQAKDALEQYEKSLAEARSEAARMLESARAEQNKLAAELRAQAEVELSSMRDRARKDIEAAKKAAVTDIYQETAKAATALAARVLQREITPRDQQRLIEESLGELQHMGAAR
jgi:F-type H+-transporting ATPase subunit b